MNNFISYKNDWVDILLVCIINGLKNVDNENTLACSSKALNLVKSLTKVRKKVWIHTHLENIYSKLKLKINIYFYFYFDVKLFAITF